MDWTDQDVEKAAHHVFAMHGPVGQVRARKRACELKRGGESQLAAVWERIADAVVQINSSNPTLVAVPLPRR